MTRINRVEVALAAVLVPFSAWLSYQHWYRSKPSDAPPALTTLHLRDPSGSCFVLACLDGDDCSVHVVPSDVCSVGFQVR